LGLRRRLESLHLPLSTPCWSVGILCSIVEIAALAMLDFRQHRPLGHRVAFEPVGHNHAWRILQAFKQPLEKRLAALALRRLCTKMSSTTPFWSTPGRRGLERPG
jgi:hypothetical protein